MRIAARFNYRCAYCGATPDRLDVEHVTPLSRGGANETSNLLPTCLLCNSDKRDLTLTEWAEDRARRNLPPRVTAWEPTDKRYWHLVQPATTIAA
jgi:5-methylcytosine-specific restriction endonuclease McrA